MSASLRGVSGRVIALILVLALTLPATPLPLDGASDGDATSRSVSIWFESAAVKVKADALPRASSSVWDGKTVTIAAARGEWESFQLVAIANPGADAAVSLADFSGDAGSIPASETDIFEVHYPSAENTNWPDALVPVPFNPHLESGRNNPFLFDVHVPTDTAPGVYHSNITLVSGPEHHRVPVVLTVWNITMPETRTLTTWFDDSGSSWASYYNYTEWSPEHLTLMENVYRQYKRYNIVPGNIPLGQVGRYNTTITNDTVSVNFTATDPWLEFCIDELGFTNFRFPLAGYTPRRLDQAPGSGHPDEIYYWGEAPYDMNGTYSDHVGQYITQVADHYREKGWLDEAKVYVVDEPVAFNDDVTGYWQHPDYHVVRQYYNLTNSSAPDLEFINTVQMVPQLWNVTDIWAVPWSTYHEMDAQGRRADGQKVWWYNTDAGIASEGYRGRGIYWDTYARGVEGALYWGTNYWTYNTVNGNPWEGSTANGDGYLFYPGDEVGIDDDVIPSQRLVLTRDGIDDYELLHMYGERYGVEAARAVAESVAAGSHFAGASFTPVEERLFPEIREWLAAEITAEGGHLTWSESFRDLANVSGMTELVPDDVWEGNLRLRPAHEPVTVDSLDFKGDWHSNDQPSLNSSVVIDKTVRKEGTGSLRIEWWRDNDTAVLGGYGDYATHQRNGRVTNGVVTPEDWTGYHYLELDVRSEEHVPGYLYLLIGDGGGTTLSSRLHPYMGYQGGPGDGWRHAVIDISTAPRSSIQYIQPMQQNYFMEEEWHHYTYWLDNITLRKAGFAPSGGLTSGVIDLGEAAGEFLGLEHITQWDLPDGAGLTFDTRTSTDGVNWTGWKGATGGGGYMSAINSPPGRYFQYRAEFTSTGAGTPVLSEVRVHYRERVEADGGLGSIVFDPDIPDEFEEFSITVPVTSGSGVEMLGVMVEFLADNGTGEKVYVGNTTVDVPSVGPVDASLNWSADNGTYEVTARLAVPGAYLDLEKGNDDAAGSIFINALPTPVMAAPAGGSVRETLTFDASDSFDDQGVINFLWDLGGELATGEVVEHAFNAEGEVAYRLTVWDEHGASGSIGGNLYIRARDPLPWFTISPDEGSTATQFTFTSASLDPEGTITNMSWDFGDGGVGYGGVVRHTFSDDVTYSVNLTLKYNTGNVSSTWVERELTIANRPPVALAYSDAVEANSSVNISFNALGTEDPDDPFDAMTFTWDFGDGSGANGTTTVHAYAGPGSYRVTLRVVDDDGLVSTDRIDITVLNMAPVANFTGPDTVLRGESFTLNASSSFDPDGAIEEYQWVFQGGAVGYGPQVTYHFDKAGSMEVNLTVTDDLGANASFVSIITVEKGEEKGGGRDDGSGGGIAEVFSGSSGSILWLVIIAIVIVVGVLMVLGAIKRGKGDEDDGEGEDGSDEGGDDEEDGGEKAGKPDMTVNAGGKEGDGDTKGGPVPKKEGGKVSEPIPILPAVGAKPLTGNGQANGDGAIPLLPQNGVRPL